MSIGIGNVFVSGSKLDTSEWVGTIKASPPDFVVREVSNDGLVADLDLTANDIPKAATQNKRKADKITKVDQTISTDVVPLDELSSLLTQMGHSSRDIVAKLNAMDDDAKGETSKHSCETPVIIESLGDKALRTKVHLLLANAFPLLDSQTSGGNAIEVTIDRRFDDLKPYLEQPTDDISLLSKFYRRIMPNPSITLRLKEGLPRSDRRPVHRIIDEKANRMLKTTTVEGAIEVSWARRNHNKERTLCVLRKVGLEHSVVMSKLAKNLHCGRNDITVAGIKDMFAVTFQFCVVTAKRKPNAIHLKGLDLLPLGSTNNQLNRGELRGNRFELVIRNLRSRSVSKLREEDVLLRISNARQFVNFYGEQRVGEPGDTSVVGIRAQDIGRAMLQRDYSKAIDLMMTGRKVVQGKIVKVEEFRRVWKESGGDATATSAVQGIPSKERMLLTGLKRFNDPLLALKCIPFHDRMLYINAVSLPAQCFLESNNTLMKVSISCLEPCCNRTNATLWEPGCSRRSGDRKRFQFSSSSGGRTR